MSILQFTHPNTPKLDPFALTTDGKFDVSSCPKFKCLYIDPDMTLLVAPVSNNVFISTLLMVVEKTVPSSVGCASLIFNTSSPSGTHVR